MTTPTPSSAPTPRTLPPPRRRETPYRIALVCLGNICRSPMAHVVLTDRLDAAGLATEVEVVSAGTGDWHVGNPMDRRAATVLTAHGYDASRHRAQQFLATWLEEQDLVLAMDEDNLRDIRELGGPDGHDPARLRLFRDFDPRARHGDREVPDPYYGGDDGFTTVLAMVERTCDALVEVLDRELVGG